MESRKIEFNTKKTLEITQDSKYGYAGEVWDSALVFCNSVKKPNFQKMFNFRDKQILELGSGTGICGIFISAMEPKKIILTDKNEALDLINKNVEINKNYICRNTEILVEEFKWDDKEKINYYKDNYKFDFIICSDIIYDKSHYLNLQEIFNELAVEKSTVIIIGFNYREEAGLHFFDFFKNNHKIWEFKKLSDDFIHEDYICEDIVLLYAIKL